MELNNITLSSFEVKSSYIYKVLKSFSKKIREIQLQKPITDQVFRELISGFQYLDMYIEAYNDAVIPIANKWTKITMLVYIRSKVEGTVDKFQSNFSKLTTYFASIVLRNKSIESKISMLGTWYNLLIELQTTIPKDFVSNNLRPIQEILEMALTTGHFAAQVQGLRVFFSFLRCCECQTYEQMIEIMPSNKYQRLREMLTNFNIEHKELEYRQFLNIFNMEISKEMPVYSIIALNAKLGHYNLLSPKVDNTELGLWIDFNSSNNSISLSCCSSSFGFQKDFHIYLEIYPSKLFRNMQNDTEVIIESDYFVNCFGYEYLDIQNRYKSLHFCFHQTDLEEMQNLKIFHTILNKESSMIQLGFLENRDDSAPMTSSIENTSLKNNDTLKEVNQTQNIFNNVLEVNKTSSIGNTSLRNNATLKEVNQTQNISSNMLEVNETSSIQNTSFKNNDTLKEVNQTQNISSNMLEVNKTSSIENTSFQYNDTLKDVNQTQNISINVFEVNKTSSIENTSFKHNDTFKELNQTQNISSNVLEMNKTLTAKNQENTIIIPSTISLCVENDKTTNALVISKKVDKQTSSVKRPAVKRKLRSLKLLDGIEDISSQKTKEKDVETIASSELNEEKDIKVSENKKFKSNILNDPYGHVESNLKTINFKYNEKKNKSVKKFGDTNSRKMKSLLPAETKNAVENNSVIKKNSNSSIKKSNKLSTNKKRVPIYMQNKEEEKTITTEPPRRQTLERLKKPKNFKFSEQESINLSGSVYEPKNIKQIKKTKRNKLNKSIKNRKNPQVSKQTLSFSKKLLTKTRTKKNEILVSETIVHIEKVEDYKKQKESNKKQLESSKSFGKQSNEVFNEWLMNKYLKSSATNKNPNETDVEPLGSIDKRLENKNLTVTLQENELVGNKNSSKYSSNHTVDFEKSHTNKNVKRSTNEDLNHSNIPFCYDIRKKSNVEDLSTISNIDCNNKFKKAPERSGKKNLTVNLKEGNNILLVESSSSDDDKDYASMHNFMNTNKGTSQDEEYFNISSLSKTEQIPDISFDNITICTSEHEREKRSNIYSKPDSIDCSESKENTYVAHPMTLDSSNLHLKAPPPSLPSDVKFGKDCCLEKTSIALKYRKSNEILKNQYSECLKKPSKVVNFKRSILSTMNKPQSSISCVDLIAKGFSTNKENKMEFNFARNSNNCYKLLFELYNDFLDSIKHKIITHVEKNSSTQDIVSAINKEMKECVSNVSSKVSKMNEPQNMIEKKSNDLDRSINISSKSTTIPKHQEEFRKKLNLHTDIFLKDVKNAITLKGKRHQEKLLKVWTENVKSLAESYRNYILSLTQL